jgi:L-arabonate dehydrase
MKPTLRQRIFTAFQAQGFTPAAYEDRPVVGICNSWSELTHCNAPLRQLAEAVKRGVWQAGGFPLEFPVMSLGEYHMRPTAMLYRNLASMDVAESIRANPLDGVVLLANCDKTPPALLLGATSADVPALLVTGGPQLKGNWRGPELGSCTDCRRFQAEWRAGRISDAEWEELLGGIVRSPGHCMTMGTASTMAALAEAMGIALPGNGAIPAVDSRRTQLVEAAGRQMVALIEQDLRPSRILTPAAFDNAIRALHALGGSTNAVIHLIALAGNLGIDLPRGAERRRHRAGRAEPQAGIAGGARRDRPAAGGATAAVTTRGARLPPAVCRARVAGGPGLRL